MKTHNSNQPGERSHGITRGHTGVLRAGGSGINLTDEAGTEADDVTDVELVGLTLYNTENGRAQIVANVDTDTVDELEARDHVHIVGETAVVDGSQTVVYLANEAELDTVAAYNAAGARVAATQDTTYLDKITYAAAPTAGTVLFDYIAATT